MINNIVTRNELENKEKWSTSSGEKLIPQTILSRIETAILSITDSTSIRAIISESSLFPASNTGIKQLTEWWKQYQRHSLYS